MTPIIDLGLHHDNPTPNEKRRIKRIIMETEYLIKWGPYADLHRINDRPRYIEAFISTEPIKAMQNKQSPAEYTQGVYLFPVPYRVVHQERGRVSKLRRVWAWIKNQ